VGINKAAKAVCGVDFPQIFLRIIDDLPIGSGFQAKTGGLKSEKVAFPVGTR